MSDTQQIKDKLDIVELIGEYVKLKPAGTNHKGLCPFHNEKSPSFMASRERQTFKCFGCGKGGDIFTFVQEIEGMSFVEALKLLADKAGIELTRQVNEVQGNQKNRIKEINLQAARFYHNVLIKLEAAKPAREYLRKRNLTDNTIEQWQIGYIPEQWDLLTKYLLKKGFSIDDLVASGLTIKRDNANPKTYRGFYDRFRGRIMFPIRDVHGGVVGFTGRVLVETEKSGGKYVNTPQTIVYDKSRIVFGLDKAKQAIRKQDRIVMVEGQMDVIACHQAGFTNVVATSGTALTEFQVKILKRYSANMNMAFDADDAGQAAAKRGIAVALEKGMHMKVIQIPEGKGADPDECVSQYPDVWQQAVDNATDIMQWYIDKAFKNKDLTKPRDKQSIVDEVLPDINLLPYAVEKDHWMGELASRIGVDIQILRQDARRIASQTPQRKVNQSPQEEGTIQKEKKTRLEQLLEQFFALTLQYPSETMQLIYDLPDQVIDGTSYIPLYEALKTSYTQGSSLDSALVRANVPAASQAQFDNLLLQAEWEFAEMSKEKALEQAKQIQAQLLDLWKKQKRQTIQTALAQAEKAGDQDAISKLLQQFQSLS